MKFPAASCGVSKQATAEDGRSKELRRGSQATGYSGEGEKNCWSDKIYYVNLMICKFLLTS
jgi:hypothetical protein